MFGCKKTAEVLLAYRTIVKTGAQFRQESITAIDPKTGRVATNRGIYEADMLVVALGADYDLAATPGWRKAATNSIHSKAPNACQKRCPASQRVTQSWG